MRRVMLFLCAMLGILVCLASVSAYHLRERDYGYVWYGQAGAGMMPDARAVWGGDEIVVVRPMHRMRYVDFSYPRYVGNRRSGKAFYESSPSVFVEPARYYYPLPAPCPRRYC